MYPYPDQTRVPTVFYNHTEEPSPLPEYFELARRPFTLTIVPVARMKPNTVYTVAFAGIVNGHARSKTWKFSTGER